MYSGGRLKDRGHFLRMACAGFEIRCHSMLTGPLGTGPRSPGSMHEGTGTLQGGSTTATSCDCEFMTLSMSTEPLGPILDRRY